jgi:hypothetical protein
MNQQEATDFVVRELAKHRRRDDLIMDLCQRTGGSWEQVDKFVRQVEMGQGKRIAARQSPLLLIIAIGTLIGGLGLGGNAVLATLNGQSLYLPGVPIPFSGNAVYLVTGLGMIAGGAFGLLRTIGSLTKK